MAFQGSLGPAVIGDEELLAVNALVADHLQVVVRA
jgi:hypothetical protein